MKIIKIAQSSNVTLPPDREINSGVAYISSNRLTKVIPSENVNREYVVRVYRYNDGMYSVVGWNGRRGGTLRPQPKYFGDSRPAALGVQGDVIRDKRWHGYEEDREAYHGPSSRSYMGRYEDVNAPSRSTTPTSTPRITAPTPPSERPSRTPSIRLQSEYIPTPESFYNTAILMRQGNREFLIMVYDYRDGHYSTIEWYSPDGREWRIHPKIVTTHIADALTMSVRLREEKLRENWAQEMEPSQVENALRSLDRGRSIQSAPPAQAVPLSPDLNTFIGEITNNQQGITTIPPVEQVKETAPKPFAEYRMPIEDEEDDVLGNRNTNMQRTSSRDWYIKTSKSISGELRGYFKFIAKVDDSTLVHNVWWEGLGDNVSITKHDLSEEEYEKYKDAIKETAKKDSVRVYKDLMGTLK